MGPGAGRAITDWYSSQQNAAIPLRPCRAKLIWGMFVKMIVGLRVLAVLGAVAFVISSAVAAPGLKSIMRGWKADSLEAARMAKGGAIADEAAFRSVLERFVAQSQEIQARISDAKASSRDLKMRFSHFEADAALALSASGQRAQWNENLAKIASDCEGCHDVYTN